MSRLLFLKADGQQPNNHTLLIAVLIAAALHLLILPTINLNTPQPRPTRHSIELSLPRPTINAAQNAAPAPPASSAQVKHNQASTPVGNTKPITSKPVIAAKNEPDSHALSSKSQPEKPAAKENSVTPRSAAPETSKPLLTAEALQQQISQLGEQIRNSSPTPQQTKIKFVNEVSKHKFLASQYLKDWEDKVERTGNLNYPEAARNKGEDQTLTMDVGINADGSIYNMRIVKSSGNAELDEAAKRIVKMSAPFAVLPYDLLQEVNVLVITKGWKFSDQSGMTTR
jgi:protein TonB